MIEQLPLFGGRTFDRDRDGKRLDKQLEYVRAVMADGEWRTLEEIARAVQTRYGTYTPTPSVSARLRDLRKPQFGAGVVEREYVERGLWRYRLTRKAA